MFTTLAYKNFRGFADLSLKGLQRVNLVVGRNNSGKTSFLEGLLLVSNPEQLGNMPGRLRPESGDSDLRYFRWLLRDTQPPANAAIYAEQEDGPRSVVLSRKTKSKPSAPEGMIRVSRVEAFAAFASASQHSLNCRVVSVLPRSPAEILASFSAAVTRRGGEERMDAIFREIDDRIRKVRVLSFEDGQHIMFDFNLSEMLPLSQVGQGVHRLITIFSELIGTDAQICIVDEIENGIHHSMLEQVWAGIATAAAKLNIQVFATTHSQECIEAAHAAFAKRETYEFSIVQLFRIEEGVQGRVLDRKHIEAAMAGEIDLR
jgi:hypothetical protein